MFEVLRQRVYVCISIILSTCTLFYIKIDEVHYNIVKKSGLKMYLMLGEEPQPGAFFHMRWLAMFLP